MVPERFKDRVIDAKNRRLKGEKVSPYELHIIAKNGEEIPTMSYVNLIQYEGKTAIVWIGVDLVK